MSRSGTIYRPLPFFLIVFALTWIPLWLLAIGLNRGWFAMSFLPVAVGGISPTFSALIMIYTSRHKKLRRDFWHRVLDPRLIPLRWLPIILLFVPLLMTVAVVISTGFEGLLSQLRPNPRFPFRYYLAAVAPASVFYRRDVSARPARTADPAGFLSGRNAATDGDHELDLFSYQSKRDFGDPVSLHHQLHGGSPSYRSADEGHRRDSVFRRSDLCCRRRPETIFPKSGCRKSCLWAKGVPCRS